MTSKCVPSRLVVPPDGLTGALMALEGVRDGAVILHGPTGCRGYHAALSELWFPREVSREPMNFTERFYFGQPRIPTTYLDQDDFVFGGAAKLRDAVATVVGRAPGLLAVINAPGASLIGDDLFACVAEAAGNVPCVLIEMPASSRSLAEGFAQAAVEALKAVVTEERRVEPGTVALLGISIAHAHWDGSIEEIRRLLRLCGVEVICVPGAGSSVEELRRIPSAMCAAVLHSEYGHAMAAWLKQRFDTPIVKLADGAPIGFGATEEWIHAIVEAAGGDPAPAIDEIRRCRSRVAQRLYRLDLFQDVVRGTRFGVHAEPSIALPLVRWLYDYLGLIPAGVKVEDGDDPQSATRLRFFLTSISCEDAWDRHWDEVEWDLLFADGPTIAIAKATGRSQGCIELTHPSDDYIDIAPKATLGAYGAMHLVERVVNGIAER